MKLYHCTAELQTICKEYWNKIARLEGDKYDLEVIEQFKRLEVIGQPARVIFLYSITIYKHFFFICLLFFLQTTFKKKSNFSNLFSKKLLIFSNDYTYYKNLMKMKRFFFFLLEF